MLGRTAGWLQRHWEYALAPLFAVAVVALLPGDCGTKGGSQDVTVLTPVVVATRAPYAPIRVLRLELDGETLIIGRTGRLLNGICNESSLPVPIDMYFGLQEVGKDPLVARTVDLVGTPRMPSRFTMAAGPTCIRTEPLEGKADERLQPGRWQLVLNMTAHGPAGEQQILTSTSKPFDVVAAGR